MAFCTLPSLVTIFQHFLGSVLFLKHATLSSISRPLYLEFLWFETLFDQIFVSLAPYYLS